MTPLEQWRSSLRLRTKAYLLLAQWGFFGAQIAAYSYDYHGLSAACCFASLITYFAGKHYAANTEYP